MRDTTAAVAAAACHDINNALTVILISLSEALVMVEPKHPVRRELLDALAAGERAAHSTAALMAFASQQGARASNATAAEAAARIRSGIDVP